MAPHAPFPTDENLFAPYELLGELGARELPVYIARQCAPVATGQLVVAQRFVGAAKAGNGAGADLRREARRLSTLANPHLARVREVTTRGDDLVVFGDFIDGEKLAQLWPAGDGEAPSLFGPVPLEVALRVLLDVLTGVGALHGLRDASQQPMKLTHAEISPATILFGADGVGRVLHAVARRAPEVRAEAASLAYLAPEVHAGDVLDGRADIFSIGVLLWEALEGRRLAVGASDAAGLRVREGAIRAPVVAETAPWAKALVPVVARALAASPQDRWPTAAAMAAEIRKAAGLKLAAASGAAAFAKRTFGDHVKERRTRWESASPSSTMPRRLSPNLGLGSMPPEASWDLTGPGAPTSIAPAPSRGPATLESSKPPPPPVSVFDPVFLDSAPPTAHPSLCVSSAPADSPDAVSESPLPREAPVVFDPIEVESTSPEPAVQEPPSLAFSGADGPNHSLLRRKLLFGAAAVLGVAAVALVAVRASHHGQPSDASSPQVSAAGGVPSAVSPAAVGAPPAAAPVPAGSSSPSTSSVATSVPSVPSVPAKPKGASKSKASVAPGSHVKSVPVRAAGHSKPGPG